ncbi:MAG: hypothetical protein OEV61_01095 [Chloroflexota bacterium]|nr:hypothetical protein [Chloroflexota bacterium]MDH5242964.1 hypothetical protein [Chloroflexota bacterium]
MSPRATSWSLDSRFVGWAVAWGLLSLVVFGVVSAIIPNPVFGRQIPPEPFAIAVWLVSAPLMGLVMATYVAPPRMSAAPVPLGSPSSAAISSGSSEREGSLLGTVAGLGAFLAIGCPVCNKIALVLLGTSGALTIYAPLQPVIGAASLALLAGTLVWRMRLRGRGGACAV